MQPLKDNYPVFEANQVLTNAHLNQVFGYLDEQQRLTRANLIGIGIVCGLEIRLDGAQGAIFLSRGCGVTSEGYLIMEPDDLALVAYRTYELPADIDYPAFKNGATSQQYPLWELFPAGEPNTTPLAEPAGFLDDKAVLLFLELKKAALRNCSPNNCNDKGSDVTVKVRRLLIGKTDLDSIIANANDASGDLEARLAAQLDLPDLRLPRFSVPNSQPVTSHDVLAAFLKIFSAGDLAAALGDALPRAYQAFQPILKEAYASDPFTGFMARFGFLDSAPASAEQVRFLPYYYDFFDDLIRAYDEFRWQGVDLLCACCPSEKLFPRHLMLGLLFPAGETDAPGYRHRFLPSAAIGDCERRTREVVLLFRRLVAMIERFTHTPALPPVKPSLIHIPVDSQIRITPSKLGDVALSEKAIPYYYQQTGEPPLYQLWNPEKTRRLRAHHNLGYRADEYTPAAPVFVTDPLHYSFESHNFLRIEGHLGKPYQAALHTLLALKNRYRLPIDIVALRTGAFDEDVEVDLDKEKCRFQDLETLYDTLREELLYTLCEGVIYLYGVPKKDAALTGGTPNHPLLKKYAPNFRYRQGTVGAWFEKYLALIQARPYIDIDQNKIYEWTALNVYCVLFNGTVDLPSENYAHVISIYYLTKLAEVLPDSLDALGYADFENKYQDLLGLIRYFRGEVANNIAEEFRQFIPQEELIDHFDHVLFSCKLAPIKALHEEQRRRIRDAKQKQFLGHFLQKHPGIQHKAGVPLGGTFVIVYHQVPKTVTLESPFIEFTGIDWTALNQNTAKALAGAINRLQFKKDILADSDVQLIFAELTGQMPLPEIRFDAGLLAGAAEDIIDATVDELIDGTVIADFYLPYLCCSECAPVQFTLPKTPPVFSVQIACTQANGTADVTVKPQGGTAPYSVNVDNSGYQLLGGALLLPVGMHTLAVRDAEGDESATQSFTIVAPMTLSEQSYDCLSGTNTYTSIIAVNGGTPPYSVNGVQLNGNSYQTPPIASGEKVLVIVTDQHGCAAEITVQHDCCDLPCNGLWRSCAYRLWLQPAEGEIRYDAYKPRSKAVLFRYNGKDFDLPLELVFIDVEDLNNNFHNVMQEAVNKLSEAIASKIGADKVVLSYDPKDNDTFALLRIDHFACETFTLQFDYSWAVPGLTHNLQVRYTNEAELEKAIFDGAIFTISSRPEAVVAKWIPAFDCNERNLCLNTQAVKQCGGASPKIDVKVEKIKNVGLLLTGESIDTQSDLIAAWVWDVPGNPGLLFQEGKTFAVPYAAIFTMPQVRLTVITFTGCFSSVLFNTDQWR